jgi:AcrR family transcriptional regulator
VQVREVVSDRGDETRQRLIEAAVDVFGERGYAGSSTRLLAARAGVNLAAIPYHFRGKRGLHVAAAEHIADQMEKRVAPLMTDLGAALDRDAAGDRRRALLHALLLGLADGMLGTAGAERWARFVAREQMDPSPAFDVLFERIMRPAHHLGCRLLGGLLGRPADDPEIMVRVFALFGQVLVFRIARAATARRLGWEALTDERVALVKDVLRAHLDGILDAELGL